MFFDKSNTIRIIKYYSLVKNKSLMSFLTIHQILGRGVHTKIICNTHRMVESHPCT